MISRPARNGRSIAVTSPVIVLGFHGAVGRASIISFSIFKLSNASFAARNAVNNQYLAPAGGGKKQISPRGEAIVKALPDRIAVAAALKSYPVRSRHKTPRKHKAKS